MPEADDISVNIDSAVDSISSELGFGKDDDDLPLDDAPPDDTPLEDAPPDDKPVIEAVPTVRSVPKSWVKDQHEAWAKIDPKTQEYIEKRESDFLAGLEQYKGDSGFGKSMRDVVTPYMATINSMGIDAPTAVHQLLTADYRLRSGTQAEKQGYFAHLAKTYGIETAVAAADVAMVDPTVKALQDQVRELQFGLDSRQRDEYNTRKAATAKDVETFAADKKHPYFDECSEDIVALINAGNTLETAYEKAVYANPVTRAKELARLQTETEAALRAKGKKEAESKRHASSTNVNSKDTRRAPTAPKGNWEDTLNETMAEIKSRETSH